MRIYRMTATFGKLEHQILELKPGLNVIEAPNEWGKSTWCAFLAAMFYGLDTRGKSTRTVLAEKQRYMPWSGSPMAGRIDLNWQGRDITIERNTAGRTPLGVFRAYETESGLPVPELTAANCGQVLLGVEQSVFRRAGFIRQTDMPLTQDEALRRRLNDLVTTGDETGEADRLARELKDIRNRCRYNRTGLLPQLEEEKRLLEASLAEHESLETHCRKLRLRLGETKSWLRELENHRMALEYAAAEADAHRVAAARDARDRAEQIYAEQDAVCAKLPSREEAEEKLRQIQQFISRWDGLQEEMAQLPLEAEPPVPPKPFRDLRGEEPEAVVAADIQQYRRVQGKKTWIIGVLLAALLWIAGIFLAMNGNLALMGAAVGGSIPVMAAGLRKKHRQTLEMEALEEKYDSGDPDAWKRMLEVYLESIARYRESSRTCQEKTLRLQARRDMLEKEKQSLCGGQMPQKVLELWQQVLQHRERHAQAGLALQRCEKHLQDLRAMAKTGVRPAMEDLLTYSMEDTNRLISDTRAEQQRLMNRMAQYRGRAETLGDPDVLRQKLSALQQRTEKLERVYEAAVLGLETLGRAQQELQRRFAPRISGRARELMADMTGGRYDRLTLQEDLSLLTGAGQEEVLREALWRSEGTVDQLYFALRLAVAEELTPEVPLVLDDVFVRFDDTRLAAALKILEQQAGRKQVILFTCQHREKEILA